MKPYRILVVDDSAFMRKLFSDIINGDPSFTVVGTAATGAQAVELLTSVEPDAVTMDMEMPDMNGLEALKVIMEQKPTPVIMLSGVSEDNMRATVAALQYGAFDFIRKPTGLTADIHQVAEQLLVRLRSAVSAKHRSVLLPLPDQPASKPPDNRLLKDAASAQAIRAAPGAAARVGRKPAVAPAAPGAPVAAGVPAASAAPQPANRSTAFRHVVAVGTSTGGPRALHQLISSLPGDLPAPVLIVQHMPPKFTHSLAQRLDSFSALSVKEAEHGEQVAAGTVYIAPGGYHMTLVRTGGQYRIDLSLGEPRGGHRPSVDQLFESLVPFVELARHAVIMTGMGSDGAKGMKALAESGAVTTIAESEETCIVFGMPRSAIELGAAKTVLPLPGIAPQLAGAVMT
ncbi:chemotaxis protein CheY [Paenibacillus darwinianus]|uniref:Protein-glutamate methylesterase/protein-glutamine glutaminase n=1 Tax=Paenibacillus darwinianus TaxID=1380763 RepID=A0A9W5W7Z8_9BACL|nr:chemotaxis response regulator protein-glutamate methylesterase [Paenibacillus darwinianus]EXX91306.1 chemotaxis protein CheY [Paenibacillus darwinianus]EXX92251.1 chemotaxis protein CheY [Paenibacillus darwinianus]EXX92826.1 chemotaxis protein CheY [Paenibacillus darwinianus]